MNVVLPALLSSTARGADLSLGALAGYRGWYDQIEGLSLNQHLFEQSLRAELDTALVRRSLAAWNVGLALDHTMTLGAADQSRVLGLRYDSELRIWEDGELPVRLFAARQITGAEQSLFPGYRVASDTWGYQAALRPPGLPRLQTLGLFQRRVTENLEVVRDDRSSILNGTLLHNDNRLLAFAEVERRRNDDPVTDDRRGVTEADGFLEYRLDRRTSMVGRARARRYLSVVGNQPYLVDTVASDATLTTRPSRKVTGVTFYRVNDQTLPEQRTGDATVASTWTWTPTDEWSGSAQGGFADSWQDDATGERSLLGQYANLSANHAHWRKGGGWQWFGQTGAANVLAGPALGGVQAGAATGGVLRKGVGPVQLSGGANVGRQIDTSPQDLSYVLWGWLGEVQSRSFHGFQVQGQATESVIAQDDPEGGDSDRVRITGLVAFRPEVQLDLSYGLNVYRDVLDEQLSSGLGHSLTARAVPTERLQLLALYQFLVSDAPTLPRYATHRVDGTILLHLPVFDVSARASRLVSLGPYTPVKSSLVWVELVRDFGWHL